MLTLLLLTPVHVVCCLSHVKCYSWVHTIILCILVTIWVDRWYLLSTCCLVLSPTCFLLCFPFMKYSECTYDLWFPSALAILPHIMFQGELSIQSRVGFPRSWHDVLYFRTHTILFFILVYSIFLDLVLEIICPWCDDYQISGW